MSRPAGVVFDVDGVLVDSGEAHFVAWTLLAKELGKTFSRDLFQKTFGQHNKYILPLWLGDDLSAERCARLSDRKEWLYRTRCRELIRPMPGVEELLAALFAAGFRLAVGSSAPEANVDLVLEALGVADKFMARSTGEDVVRGKPDPEVFLKAAAGLELPPGRCVVVEDAPAGVEAALAAGSSVIAVTTSHSAEQLSRAHRIVDSLSELTPDSFLDLLRAAEGGG